MAASAVTICSSNMEAYITMYKAPTPANGGYSLLLIFLGYFYCSIALGSPYCLGSKFIVPVYKFLLNKVCDAKRSENFSLEVFTLRKFQEGPVLWVPMNLC